MTVAYPMEESTWLIVTTSCTLSVYAHIHATTPPSVAASPRYLSHTQQFGLIIGVTNQMAACRISGRACVTARTMKRRWNLD